MTLADELGERALWANASALHGWFLVHRGRMSDGIATVEEAYRVAEDLGLGFVTYVAAWIRAACAMSFWNDLPTARRWLERELTTPRAAQSSGRGFALANNLRQIGLWMGEVAMKVCTRGEAATRTASAPHWA